MSRPQMTNDQGKLILERIRKVKPFIQASFTITKKRPIHEAALLTWKEVKRTQTLYVPVEFREEVARWVQEGKILKSLIAEMSKAQREFLINKKKSMKA